MSQLWRTDGERPRVYGHRGTRGRAGVLENTLPAFELAMEQGADGVELDVRLSADGQLFVIHDADLVRTHGSERVVAESSAAELRAAGVPTLDAALDAVFARGGVVNVEAKGDVPDRDALVDALVRVLGERSRDGRAQIFLSSFSRRICRALSEVLDGVPVLLLLKEAPAKLPVLEGLPAVVGVHPKGNLLSAQTLEHYRAGSAVVNCWTINDAREARRLSELGVDGIITDDVPAVLGAL